VHRQILRVSWEEHGTNVSVLQEIKIKKRLPNQIIRAYLSYFGHIARRTGVMDNLVVEEKRPGGRSPMMRTDRLIELTGPTMYETIHLAQSKHLIEDKSTDVAINSATEFCSAYIMIKRCSKGQDMPFHVRLNITHHIQI